MMPDRAHGVAFRVRKQNAHIILSTSLLLIHVSLYLTHTHFSIASYATILSTEQLQLDKLYTIYTARFLANLSKTSSTPGCYFLYTTLQNRQKMVSLYVYVYTVHYFSYCN